MCQKLERDTQHIPIDGIWSDIQNRVGTQNFKMFERQEETLLIWPYVNATLWLHLAN